MRVMAGSDGAKEGCERGQTFFDRTSRMPAGPFQHCERLRPQRSTAIHSVPTVEVSFTFTRPIPISPGRNLKLRVSFLLGPINYLAKRCAHRPNLTLRLGTDIPPRCSTRLVRMFVSTAPTTFFACQSEGLFFSQCHLQGRTMRG